MSRKIDYFDVLPPDVASHVFVYRNLHKTLPDGTPVWSCRDTDSGLVVAHARIVTLRNAVFKVGQKGRLRVVAEQRKNVHAGVRGEPVEIPDLTIPDGWIQVTYNPYQHTTFVDATDRTTPIYESDAVIITDRVWVPASART